MGERETEVFRAARDHLLAVRTDRDRAVAEFRWPRFEHFNWALDWFDVLAEEEPGRPALRIVRADDEHGRSFGDLRRRSDQVANHLRSLGVGRGDRVLLMLGNVVPLSEVLLGAMKLGAVVVPATTLLAPADLRDRIDRGGIRAVVAADSVTDRFAGLGGAPVRVAVGEPVPGWEPVADAESAPTSFEPDGPTGADDLLLLYFTSGTTALPKMVAHTHASYPVGHLSTMYWIGLEPGDVHLNISSPGWAKHAWSCVFAPWIAGATVLVHDVARFAAPALLDVLVDAGVTTFCAPPTVWRMLVQEDLGSWAVSVREALSAGEPLNPEVIDRVRSTWGLTIRDGYGQTETTAQIGNPPGFVIRPGSMGKPLPGYPIVLVDANGEATVEGEAEGEVCIDLGRRPVGLMAGYLDDEDRTEHAMAGGWYHTGDVAQRDADGYITFVGRTDDVFKASDYRISPFELESVLIEHEWVAEAAVVPSPDPLRLAVPKAYVVLVAGVEPTPETAAAILDHARSRLAPFKRIRRIEFAELPKTICGKIRRVELREAEEGRAGEDRRPSEWWEEDLRS